MFFVYEFWNLIDYIILMTALSQKIIFIGLLEAFKLWSVSNSYVTNQNAPLDIFYFIICLILSDFLIGSWSKVWYFYLFNSTNKSNGCNFENIINFRHVFRF